MSNLYEAHAQWKTRPDDERFETLEEMMGVCRAYADISETRDVGVDRLALSAYVSGDLLLDVGDAQTPSSMLSHYAFGQLCARVGAPAGFLRELPPTLARDVVNNRLSELTADARTVSIYTHMDTHNPVVRAITSDRYDRVWNHDLISRGLIPLAQEGWRTAPARPARAGQARSRIATEADILPGQDGFGLSVKVGDMIAPAGLYASDHDMFAFLVNPTRESIDVGGRQLMRGLFVRNSEVGDGALVFDWFDLDCVCGNHICWGVSNHNRIRARHLTSSDKRNMHATLDKAMDLFEIECEKDLDQLTARNDLIQKARKYEIAGTKEELIDAVFGFARKRGLTAISKKIITSGVNVAEEHTDWYGSPHSVFGVVSGITQHSQTLTGYADHRHTIDVQASRLFEMAM